MALANATFSEILDDLSSRFIINVPEEELASIERICFQIEQAHWFYEDFVREQNPSLPSFNLKNFSAKFFKHCPLLHQWSHEHEKAFADFMQYKIRVPVCGAIMLNSTMEKCVLVKGWSSRSGWGFPKGKINKDEPDSTCAAREVLEETGYDISPLIKEQDYVELTIRDQRIRLYIVVGVLEDTKFSPRTRKEISKIEWHKVADLPTWKSNKDTPYHCGGGCVKYGSSRYYMVVPFVSKLRYWLKTQKKIARKKAAEALNQEESTEVVIFNGHATTSDIKEISPETSVPSTESEGGSPHGQSPNIGAQLDRSSTQIIDPQNFLKSILCPNRPTSAQPTNNSVLMSQEELMRQQMISTQFKQNHSYFSTGLPSDQLSQTALAQMKQHFVVDEHPTTLPYRLPELGNLQNPNSIFSRSNSQTPIQNKHSCEITAPVPIHANMNVAIAALDPEQKLRRNSLLSLFTASTSARQSSSNTPASSEYDMQRRNSLLNVLQPETSVTTPSKNLTHDDIVQHQLQQSKVQYFTDSYDTIKSHVRNDSIFNMFQNHVNQNISNNVVANSQSETIFTKDPVYNEDMSQSAVMPKVSSNIGHIGQGRPLNDSDNEIHEVARKMSLLGLLSAVSNSGTSGSQPSLQSKLISPNIIASSVINNSSTKATSSQGYGQIKLDNPNTVGKVDEENNKFLDTQNIDSHEGLNLQTYDSSDNFVEISPDLRVRRELLDHIHTFIPQGDTKPQENNLCHAQPCDKNPMTSFKFDVEKIVAAL